MSHKHILHLIGHFYAHIMIGFYTVLATLSFYNPISKSFDRGDEIFLTIALVVTFLGVLIVGISTHRKTLCERCVSKIPLDAADKAEHWESSLKWYHLIYDTTFGFPLAMFVWLITGYLLKFPLGEHLTDIIVYLPLVWLMVSVIRHDKVQPWCWRCRGDDGDGDHESVSSPDPAISK